jgi:hypothetical protein
MICAALYGLCPPKKGVESTSEMSASIHQTVNPNDSVTMKNGTC